MLNLFMKEVSHSNVMCPLPFRFGFSKLHECIHFLKLGWQQWWLWVSRLSISQEKDSTAPKGFAFLHSWNVSSPHRGKWCPIFQFQLRRNAKPLGVVLIFFSKLHECNHFLKLGWQQWWLWVSRLSISQEKDSTAPKGFAFLHSWNWKIGPHFPLWGEETFL